MMMKYTWCQQIKYCNQYKTAMMEFEKKKKNPG